MFKARRRKYYRLIIKQDITGNSVHVYWNEMEKADLERLTLLNILDFNETKGESESCQIFRRYNIPQEKLAEFILSYCLALGKQPIVFYLHEEQKQPWNMF